MLRNPLDLKKLKRAVSPRRFFGHQKASSSSSVSVASNVPTSTANSVNPGISTPTLNSFTSTSSVVTRNQTPQVVIPTINLVPNPAFFAAVKQHEQKLSESERAAFQAARVDPPQELIKAVRKFDEEHKSLSISRPMAPRVEKVLKGMNQFMNAVATCIQQSPDISSLVVGGLMCVLQALAKAYGDLLEFFTTARRVFTNSDGKVSRWASFKVFLNLTWQPFESGFYDIQVKFMNHAQIVTREAQVRGFIDDYSERQRIKLREDLEDKERKDEKRRKVLGWLSTVDFEKVHQNHFSKHFEGTGQWFLRDERFEDWEVTPEAGLLWCHGTPGTGKTTLCSLVLETVTEKYASCSSTTGIAFAYCNYKEPQEPATYIATFIKQLCRAKEVLPKELESLFDSCHRNAKELNYTELQQIFTTVVKSFDKVFIILDALDECPDEQRAGFLKFLTSIVNPGRDGPANIKLFVTSRRETDIARSFASFPTIQIEAKEVASDIESYVKFELDRCLGDGTLKIADPKLKEEILEALLKKAGGMFLWVKFQLHDICSQLSDHGIREALVSLPETMEKTYINILLKIDKKPKAQKALAKKILMWVAHAQTPLTLLQLAEAISIEPSIASPEGLHLHKINDLSMLADVCLNLVVIDENNDESDENCIIRFSHYSVQEFLTLSDVGDSETSRIIRTYKPETQSANHEIARACLLHLTSRNGYGPELFFLRNFAIYAAKYFPIHVRALEQLSPELWELIYNFINSGEIFHSMIGRFTGTIMPPADSKFPIILIAMILDMPPVVDRLTEEEDLKEENPEQTYKDALHWAAQRGSRKAVEWLLSRGCDLNETDSSGFWNPLVAAIRFREKDIVELLLAKGADVNRESGHYKCPLGAAVSVLDKDIVELLLRHGADPNAKGRGGIVHLQEVASASHSGFSIECAQLLLAEGVNVNARGYGHGSALNATANIWDLVEAKNMTQLLLENGAEVNASDEKYGSALQHHAMRGFKEVVQFLLDAGANANVRGGRYGNALQAAAVFKSDGKDNSHRDEIVRLLLEKGADVNAPGGRYGSALRAAMKFRGEDRGEEVVELLLAYGAEENIGPNPNLVVDSDPDLDSDSDSDFGFGWGLGPGIGLDPGEGAAW